MAKGRNQELAKIRDEALFHRFNYLTEIRKLSVKEALKQLSEHEFYISEYRIISILQNRNGKES